MNTSNFYSVENISHLSLNTHKHVHLIGVCGVAMGQLAVCLKRAGLKVSGSDKEFYDPTFSILKREEIKIFEGFDGSNLNPVPDLVIIGNSISANNPEVSVVEELKIPYSCLPACTADLLVNNRKPIVITGTHGKSTTSSLMVRLLTELGLKPGFMVGAEIVGNKSSFEIGNDAYTVLEGDEYDSAFFAKIPKFYFYNPHILIITSLEFDHADIYNSLDQVVEVFYNNVKNLKPNSVLIINQDTELLVDFLKSTNLNDTARVITYGTKESRADWRIVDFKAEGPSSSIVAENSRNEKFAFKIPLMGIHNALNALACTIVADTLGYKASEITPALSRYQGITKRLNKVIDQENYIVYEDFAHHPTAVKATINAIKEAYPEHELVAVFEPRSNTSRRKIFELDYIKSLSLADRILIRDVIIRHNDNPNDLIDVKKITNQISLIGKSAKSFKTTDEILAELLELRKYRCVVVIMSNGSFENLVPKLISNFK